MSPREKIGEIIGKIGIAAIAIDGMKETSAVMSLETDIPRAGVHEKEHRKETLAIKGGALINLFLFYFSVCIILWTKFYCMFADHEITVSAVIEVTVSLLFDGWRMLSVMVWVHSFLLNILPICPCLSIPLAKFYSQISTSLGIHAPCHSRFPEYVLSVFIQATHLTLTPLIGSDQHQKRSSYCSFPSKFLSSSFSSSYIIMNETETVKVAVIGSGLAGLTATYLLNKPCEGRAVRFEVHLFEKVSRHFCCDNCTVA